MPTINVQDAQQWGERALPGPDKVAVGSTMFGPGRRL